MDITQLFIKLVIAVVCAAIADVLIPRKIPGGLAGLILIGLAGIWVGEWGFALMRQRFGLNLPFLYWSILDVPIIPAIIGCAIVLYVITAFLSWGRYGR